MTKEVNSTSLLRQVARTHGFALDELARRALIPHTTFFRRLGRPSTFTIGNLRDMFDAMALDADDSLTITAELLWGEGAVNA